MNKKLQPTTDNGQRNTDKQNWRLYAAAAGAALAFTTGADASVIYSGVLDQQVSVGGHFTVGGQIGGIGGSRTNGSSGHGAFVNLGIYNAQVINSGEDIVNFGPGGAIGGTHVNGADWLRLVWFSASGAKFPAGNFLTGQTGVAGFKFNTGVDGGGDGWIRVKVEADANGFPDEAEIIDWAYNDAGGGINAGQTVGVPEPSALGLLALGSAGVLAWRRKRNASAE